MIFSCSKNKKKSPKRTTAQKLASSKKPKKTRQKAKKIDNKRQPIAFKVFYLCVYSILFSGLIVAGGLIVYGTLLNQQYKLSKGALDGVLWELPSRVYARPLELYADKPLKMQDLITELDELSYIQNPSVSIPGTYHLNDQQILINKYAFSFWDGEEKSGLIRITIKDDHIADLTDMSTLSPIAITRLEPMLIGSIYPKDGQDRILISLKDTPNILIDTILATEDRRFYQHIGIDLRGFSRAVWHYVKTGHASQGASTITQQFIKNHYLNRSQTIRRKVKEALMALIIEHYYTKHHILEGYLNEIFLGQDGNRAIHGFGLAAEYYFGKRLQDLELHQIASLVALVREPNRANPFRHPAFALKRRHLILRQMVEQHLISQKDADLAAALPLDTMAKGQRGQKDRYYSFLQLVYKQLHRDYNQKDLASGLNIFTTLDPIIQNHTEQAVRKTLPALEKTYRLAPNFLQAASLVVNPQTAEIIAIIGDRNPSRRGFNRAFQARRQTGSSLKPIIYLAALEYPQRFSLATSIDNADFVYQVKGETWKPRNFEKNSPKQVLLVNALIHSYNIATARIALDIGIDDVIGRLQDFGARKDLPHFPSIALGGVGMSPIEVAQIYVPLSNGGYRMPLRVIRSVTDVHNTPLKRYPIDSIKVISDGPYYLIVKVMQDIVRRGTAKRLNNTPLKRFHLAGKTGTTNDYRDSWFSGFSGNYLTVVWVGNDQNKKTKLTGAKGALKVWTNIMKKLPLTPLTLKKPDSVVEENIDLSTGFLMDASCQDEHQSAIIPFLVGSEPTFYSNCYPALPAEYIGDDDDHFDNTPFDNDYQQPNSRHPQKPSRESIFD